MKTMKTVSVGVCAVALLGLVGCVTGPAKPLTPIETQVLAQVVVQGSPLHLPHGV